MAANKDCKIEPRSQQFLVFEKLHILGAVINKDQTGVSIFETVEEYNYDNVVPHGVYSMFAIHADPHPTRGVMNIVDWWSSSHQESGTATETTIYRQDTSYRNDINYSSLEKQQEYLETSFIKSSVFYEIPTQNILSAGVIKNKITNQWELCLIDEGNEKSFYTLEARLFTHGELGSQADIYNNPDADFTLTGSDDYVFNTHFNNTIWTNGGPNNGYFLRMIDAYHAEDITQSILNTRSQYEYYKTEVALQHYYIFDDYTLHNNHLPAAASPNWHGWVTNKFEDSIVFNATNLNVFERYKDLRDINSNTSAYQATHFNFFTNQKHSKLANKFACNQDFAIGNYPGYIVSNGGTEGAGLPYPSWENNISYGWSSGKEPNRYYLCYNKENQYGHGRNEPPYRYIGSVLSDPNAFDNMLMVMNDGQIVRGFDWITLSLAATNSLGLPSYFNTAYHKPCNLGRQNNLCLPGVPGQGSYGSTDSHGYGELLYRIPFKGGVSSMQFNYNSNCNGNVTHTGYVDRQGYLYDRDVMLFAPAPDFYSSTDWDNGENSEDTYLGNMLEETGLYNQATGVADGPGVNVPTEASEIEFELFYCANINTPTAAMTLLDFGKKLNKKISGFDTKIKNDSNSFDKWNSYNYPNVIIKNLENFDNASIIYGSTIELDTSQFVTGVCGFYGGQDDNIEYSGKINIIPTVEIKNVYVWENGGTPKKGSKTLKGTKTTIPEYQQDEFGHNYTYLNELYSYGEYFIAYFAHKLFLIDKVTFDKYMYDAEEFTELIQELAYNPCASDYSGNNKKYSDFGDPFKYGVGSSTVCSAIAINNTITDSTESGSPTFLRNGYTWGITNN